TNKEQAFSLLLNKYKERLYWHCRRLLVSHEDADDALQNTFIKIWSNLGNFRGDAELYTWLFRIATNESLTLLRKKNKFVLKHDSDNDTVFEETLVADAYFDGNEIQIKLQKAIKKLPEKQKVVFNLKYYEEMKYEEMAEVLETSVGALKASYHHAVKKIEQALKTDE
ncbi:MAG TPA: RNA polymerase sigma factor, partial [Bacteroidales bacterium]|nr:RNA polymerase sigma factor [Bacteroidales bacterium]